MQNLIKKKKCLGVYGSRATRFGSGDFVHGFVHEFVQESGWQVWVASLGDKSGDPGVADYQIWEWYSSHPYEKKL